ncbi:coproporphyrinogen III oxidase [Bacillus sp. C1]
MALQHEFVFVPNEQGELGVEDFSWNDSAFFYKDGTIIEDCVILHDEIIMYISDFLYGIPTYNPSKREKGFGLHYYGITKIEKEGAEMAGKLFRSLIGLFSLAPENIKLTGSFQWTNGYDTDGEYERLMFDRDILCEKLESLVRLLHKVEEGKGYILHFGV